MAFAVAFVIAIAALYVGRAILVPLALAVLLSFMLAPLVSWLQRRRVPKILAVIAVVVVAFSVVGGFGFVTGVQLTQVAQYSLRGSMFWRPWHVSARTAPELRLSAD